MAFGMNEDAGEEVWGPGDEGFEVYMYDDDDDEGEGEVTQERGRGIRGRCGALTRRKFT